MRGIDKWNFPAFDAAAASLRAYDVGVISPAEMDRELGLNENDYPDLPEWFTVEDALKRDFEAIDSCTGVCFLPGWENSSGAKEELQHAIKQGKNLYLYAGADARPMMQAAPPDKMLHWAGLLPEHYHVRPSDTGEVRSVNALTGGEKGVKPARFDLIPVGPLTALAVHYGVGANKYADRNWEKGYEWGKSYAALQRHLTAFWNGEDIDEDTGSPHLAAVVFHAFAMLEWGRTHPELDDRPKGNN